MGRQDLRWTLRYPSRVPSNEGVGPILPGVHAWRLLPHTLAYNLYTLVFSFYHLKSLTPLRPVHSAAVAALMAYQPLPQADYGPFSCVLTCLGAVAVPSTIFKELLEVYYHAYSQQLEQATSFYGGGDIKVLKKYRLSNRHS